MLVIFPLLVGVLAFLQWVWPSLLGWSIRRGSTGGFGGWIANYVAVAIFFLSILFAGGLAALLKVTDKDSSWTDTQPALTGLGITLGLVFAFSRLAPPAFWASFREVKTDGSYDRSKLAELELPAGGWCPIFLEVHNASISAWSNYRITVSFEDGGCELRPAHDHVPASESWEWKTEFRPHAPGQPFLQVQGGNTLAVAEPQTVRFVARTPDGPRRFRAKIALVADGRVGESRRSLWVKVRER